MVYTLSVKSAMGLSDARLAAAKSCLVLSTATIAPAVLFRLREDHCQALYFSAA
ncbi:hypothetical protein Pmar_PMAR028396 [Perkinsus marinus ATCC 50983]|uniref:Uncharacterized protein n=1 Tax=Perkinsus marinus (strain ATCC 50983 / TXsc) TaxID=423536 RepID=C5M0A0_PERM5|nr:hypothetical protein Pmar_PMAR028396 [Perkinsus marinus ATCC 50983]EEQ97589.1 hypothetical protein Pmar_PMAR028396 [Perkinsus marinus ATCC 50983]|eukprot:XP_002764872.1 hypothetical protein Pmar_PMAR028396 [Perkinsus marinus ATCC 50983]